MTDSSEVNLLGFVHEQWTKSIIGYDGAINQPVHYVSQPSDHQSFLNSHISLSYSDTHCKHLTLTLHSTHAQGEVIHEALS